MRAYATCIDLSFVDMDVNVDELGTGGSCLGQPIGAGPQEVVTGPRRSRSAPTVELIRGVSRVSGVTTAVVGKERQHWPVSCVCTGYPLSERAYARTSQQGNPMLQGHGDGGPRRASHTCDWSHEAERLRREPGAPEAVAGTEARPTPLPKVNFTLLGVAPHGASPSSPPGPPPLLAAPPLMSGGYRAAPSDAELDALLRQVDQNLDRTLELDARPVRPPWIRSRRRKSIWAGLVLYLAVGSASFLWFAERAKRPLPAAEPALSEANTASTLVPAETLSASAATAHSTQRDAADTTARRAEPIAHPASAAPLHARKAERRVIHKKAKRAGKLLATRAKRKKRVARAQAL